MEREDFLKTIPQIEELYAIINSMTRMPHVICDPDTFDDTVTMYAKKEDAEAAAKKLIQYHTPCGVLVVRKNIAGSFYVDLMLMGVNRVDFIMEEETYQVDIAEIIKKKAEMPDGQKPIENPELKLSMTYFFQEMRKQIPPQEKKNIRQLEEEMVVNFMRATYIMPLMQIETPTGEKAQTYLQLKNPDGESYVAAFTDIIEYNKFIRNGEKLPIVAGDYRKFLEIRKTKLSGVVINPAGINVVLSNENMTRFEQAFELPEE